MAPLTALQLTVADVCVMDVADNPIGSPQGAGVPMVKLVLEISKKIFPTASTFMRLVVPVVEGTETSCEPSFGVDEANTMGKLFPPSVDSKILTAAQFTEPALVPLTLQVTVAVPPAGQVTLVFGAVTWNGPAVFVTVTTTSEKAVCPTATGAVEL